MPLEQRHHRYWQRNLRFTGLLLSLWFLVTFVVSYFAPDLSEITVFGLPFGFYMAAQGAPLIYALIVGSYALYMNWLDLKYGVHDGTDNERERER
ncbi:MAG TPA: DUF4212 domain-containing protein [Accumulibacter sp.]|nr:DUF4212 domain-containing protein [Accumulibacter sp.]HMW19048.1 DUF4212 domain-containing protein [Accumulibacter sp.]HMX23053.1 DUF4212 domain-containing protein [Accumulibacter sp.]HMY06549.1 DUF4212 domain-containing protein [Accumulibacter sp.]HNC19035.1 DUF4212 domain-containing protein [Accumulibacter sp.]